ncbi:AAEL007805-PA, partial [Aedes aegypti]
SETASERSIFNSCSRDLIIIEVFIVNFRGPAGCNSDQIARDIVRKRAKVCFVWKKRPRRWKIRAGKKCWHFESALRKLVSSVGAKGEKKERRLRTPHEDQHQQQQPSKLATTT